MTSAALDGFRVQRFFSLIDDPFPLAPLSLIGIAILCARFGDKVLGWDKDRGGFLVWDLRGVVLVWCGYAGGVFASWFVAAAAAGRILDDGDV